MRDLQNGGFWLAKSAAFDMDQKNTRSPDMTTNLVENLKENGSNARKPPTASGLCEPTSGRLSQDPPWPSQAARIDEWLGRGQTTSLNLQNHLCSRRYLSIPYSLGPKLLIV